MSIRLYYFSYTTLVTTVSVRCMYMAVGIRSLCKNVDEDFYFVEKFVGEKKVNCIHFFYSLHFRITIFPSGCKSLQAAQQQTTPPLIYFFRFFFAIPSSNEGANAAGYAGGSRVLVGYAITYRLGKCVNVIYILFFYFFV